jgi:hypothetical protein
LGVDVDYKTKISVRAQKKKKPAAKPVVVPVAIKEVKKQKGLK